MSLPSRTIHTLRDPWVWLGLAGTAAMAWGGTNDEFSFSPDGWPNQVVKALGAAAFQPLDKILIVLGAIALTTGWWHVRPTRTRPPVHTGLTLTLWCLPLLLVPPLLSPDATLYADVGWTANAGADPYLVGLGTLGGPYAVQVDPLWAGNGVAYPPLAVILARAMVALAGADPYWGFVAMRLPVVASVAVMFAVMPKLAVAFGLHLRRTMWLGLLNPLLVIHIVGGAHNDAPMIAVTLVAIWLAVRWPRAWMSLLVAPVVVGVAMALKQQGGLAVVAVAGLPVAARLASLPRWPRLRTLGWRTATATAVTCASFAAICLASGLGFGWIRWLDLMGKAWTPAPLALLSKLGTWAWQFGGGDADAFARAAGLVCTAILAVVVLGIVVRFADRPMHAVAWGALAVAILGEAMHPWYLPWGLALLGLLPLTQKQRRWVWGLALAFTVWNAFQTVIWHGQP